MKIEFKAKDWVVATHAVGVVIQLAVYTAVAWSLAKWFDMTVWRALLALVAVGVAAQLFFGTLNLASNALVWRLVGRRMLTAAFLELLRDGKFPPPRDAEWRFDNYLFHLQSDNTQSAEIKDAARSLLQLVEQLQTQNRKGLIDTLVSTSRVSAACEAALNEYFPQNAARQELAP